MDLRTYTTKLAEERRGALSEFAAKLGISPVYLSQLSARQGGREPSPELCVVIERATEGAVSRRDLRPDDWSRIWPELVENFGPIDRGDATDATAPNLHTAIFSATVTDEHEQGQQVIEPKPATEAKVA